MSGALTGDDVCHMRSLSLTTVILLVTATSAAMACEVRITGRIEPAPNMTEDLPEGAEHMFLSIGTGTHFNDGLWRSIDIEITQRKFPVEFDLPFAHDRECAQIVEVNVVSPPERQFYFPEDYLFAGRATVRLGKYAVIKVHAPAF